MILQLCRSGNRAQMAPAAERAVLGAALLEPETVVPLLKEALTVDDFYERRHQLFFEAILALHEQGAPITEHEVWSLLEREGKLRDCGDLPSTYLTDLRIQCPGVACVNYYIEQIREASWNRNWYRRLLETAERVGKGDRAALEELEEQIKLDRLAEASAPAAPPRLEFPESACLGMAAEFADAYATACESPKSFFYCAFLTCLGALVGDRVALQGATRAPARLYTVLLGPSGISRKSTAIRLTTDFFARKVQGFPIIRGLGSAEGLAKTISKRGYTNCLLVFDELRTFVEKAKIEGSILLSIVNSLFEETRAENHTKGHSIELQDVHLSLLSACTLDTFSNLFDAHFIAIGFPNRLLLVLDEARERIPIPREVPERVEQALAQKLGAILYNLRPYTPEKPLVMHLTQEALELWGDFYKSLPRTVASTRLDAIGLRLAMLIALSSGKSHLDAETISAAIALTRWQLAIREEVMPTEAANSIANMEQKIVKVLKSRGPLGQRALRDRTNAYRAGLWVFDTALKNLIAAKVVHYDPRNRVYAVLD